MTLNFRLYRLALSPWQVAALWEALAGLTFTRVEGPTMRLSKALQGENAGNPQAAHLLNVLHSLRVHEHASYDDLVIVRYDQPEDFIDWHTDGGIRMQPGAEVGIVSLGASREIEFRPIGGAAEETESVLLEAGDILVMGAGFQGKFEHRVPPSTRGGVRYAVILFTHRRDNT